MTNNPRLGRVTPWTFLFLILFASLAAAVPKGPTLSYITTTGSSQPDATIENNESSTGGTISVVNIDSNQPNNHYKAYVGNVTGRLILEDAFNFSIYQWDLAVVEGEVYATRSGSVNWSTVECANSSHMADEMTAMNHTSSYTPNDGLNITFNDTNAHAGFVAGPITISANSCNYTTQTYVNGSKQGAPHQYEEVVLYDGTSIIYTSIIETDESGYHTGEQYDYQMLVPEKGEPEAEGTATSYYFYVELL